MAKAKQAEGTKIKLEVEFTKFEDDPLRFRQSLADATVGDHEVEISLCASGAHVYVRGNGKQVALSLRDLCSAALPELGIEV